MTPITGSQCGSPGRAFKLSNRPEKANRSHRLAREDGRCYAFRKLELAGSWPSRCGYRHRDLHRLAVDERVSVPRGLARWQKGCTPPAGEANTPEGDPP